LGSAGASAPGGSGVATPFQNSSFTPFLIGSADPASGGIAVVRTVDALPTIAAIPGDNDDNQLRSLIGSGQNDPTNATLAAAADPAAPDFGKMAADLFKVFVS